MFKTINSGWQNDFPESFAALNEFNRDAAVRRQRLSLSHLPLSIGVMGQVKAGKSSFLNAALFQGRPLLPEAATPKTANLTRICYAQQASFTAHFYSADDWARIEHEATLGSQDDSCQAAQELVQSAASLGTEKDRVLALGQVTHQAADMQALKGALNDYVGSDGRYTALVARTELALPLPELEGIEIVDTPGVNDPVVSRTDKTREYMAQCDVVFFLTRTSQFFDSSDQLLMSVQLPQKGIKRLILVGAQFDGALLDDGFNRKSLDQCRTRIVDRLSLNAQKVLHGLAEQREKIEAKASADLLRSVQAPIFASTHARIISTRNSEDWSASVHHSHCELQKMAQASWGARISPEQWGQIANFEPLMAALTKARQDKEALLAQQRAGLEQELAAAWQAQLQSLRDLAQARLQSLQTQDLASLAARESAQQQQVLGVSAALTDYLRQTIETAQTRQTQVLEDLQRAARRAGQVDERTGHERSRETYTVSDAIWYNPFSWFSSHEESYSTTTSYRYLAVSDAMENLRFYVQSARHNLLAAFDDVLSQSKLSAALRREVLRAMQQINSDFDAKGLRALIESSLAQLQLPALDFEAPDVQQLFAGFSGEVKDVSAMHDLRARLTQAVQALNGTLSARLQETVASASTQLETIAAQLHSSLTRRVTKEIALLREQMQDKEKHIAHLQKLLDTIDQEHMTRA